MLQRVPQVLAAAQLAKLLTVQLQHRAGVPGGRAAQQRPAGRRREKGGELADQLRPPVLRLVRLGCEVVLPGQGLGGRLVGAALPRLLVLH